MYLRSWAEYFGEKNNANDRGKRVEEKNKDGGNVKLVDLKSWGLGTPAGDGDETQSVTGRAVWDEQEHYRKRHPSE